MLLLLRPMLSWVVRQGRRDTDLLEPDKTVQSVDAIVLSGGSAFGLDSAGGVAHELRATGRGFAVGDVTIPIVPCDPV